MNFNASHCLPQNLTLNLSVKYTKLNDKVVLLQELSESANALNNSIASTINTNTHNFNGQIIAASNQRSYQIDFFESS